MVGIVSDLSTRVITKEGCQEKERHLRSMIYDNFSRIPQTSTIPIDYSMEVAGLNIEECKVMDSKKMPL